MSTLATSDHAARVLPVYLSPPLPPGHALMTSETVRKIGFTGSTAVGKMLAEQAAKVNRKKWLGQSFFVGEGVVSQGKRGADIDVLG